MDRIPTDRSLYVISVAAELAGVHPQTLRIYERKGLVTPERTTGNSRRYSESDIARLLRIQELTREGLNLAGVVKVIELEGELKSLAQRFDEVFEQLERVEHELREAMDARDSNALVLHRDVRRVRRAMKSDAIEQATRRRTFIAPPVANDKQ